MVKAAGGVLIADEVQPGFGRGGVVPGGATIGWGMSPDVVTLGQSRWPMGIRSLRLSTRSEVMSAFRNAFGYFNTFGGNPVSCAAAAATLDVIEQDNLVENARIIGANF